MEEEIKKKRVAWNKGLKGVMPTPWNKGKKGLFTGRKHTPEAIAKIKAARAKQIKGPTSEATKKKLSEALRGKIVSSETRKKLSEARIGIPLSPAHIDSLRLSHLGFKPTEETRKKLSEAHKREKHWNWKGGIGKNSTNEKCRKSPEYRDWRKSCFERDSYTCQITNTVAGELQVHHINNFADNQDLRFDVNNGITISKELHELFHSIYGRKNNTREQLDEFINNYAVTNNTNISGGTEGIVG